MKLSVSGLIVGWLSYTVLALEKGNVHKSNVPSANALASGQAATDKLNAKSTDVENKLDKKVGEMLVHSVEMVKSLKGMLTTNGKAIAALTGLFKEVSRLTGSVSEYEAELRKCKEELATVKSQQQAGPDRSGALFESAMNDPLAGFSFFQEKAETALAHANSMFSKIYKNQTGISLLQRRHRHRRRGGSEEQNSQGAEGESGAQSDSAADSAADAVSLSMSTINVGEEDMDSRLRSFYRSNGVLPGMHGLDDPLQYGMIDFTGTHGVKIFDHASLDPNVQRQRELREVNRLTLHGKVSDDEDDD